MAGSKYAWSRVSGRVTATPALGGADAAQHLQGHDGGGSDRTQGQARIPYTPPEVLDAAGTVNDGGPGLSAQGVESHADDGQHSTPDGAVSDRLARAYAPRALEDGLSYMSPREQRAPQTTAGSVTATQRGTNGLPLNNPDGFPLGHRITRLVDRIVRPPAVIHEARPVHTAPGTHIPTVHDNVPSVRTSPFPNGVAVRRRIASVYTPRVTPPSPESTYAQAPVPAPAWANEFASW